MEVTSAERTKQNKQKTSKQWRGENNRKRTENAEREREREGGREIDPLRKIYRSI